MVTVRGPSDDVEKAVKLLMEMSKAEQLSGVTVEIKAKPQHHKFLIGTDVNNIQKIRDDTGARIIFPSINDTDKETIVIIGTQVACDKAKKIMEAKIVELDSIVEDSMNVAPKHFMDRMGEDTSKLMESEIDVAAEAREDKFDVVEKEDEVTNCPAEKLPDIKEIQTIPDLKSGSWEGQCGHEGCGFVSASRVSLEKVNQNQIKLNGTVSDISKYS